MTPKITDDQRQAIAEIAGTPVSIVDAVNNANDMLLPAD